MEVLRGETRHTPPPLDPAPQALASFLDVGGVDSLWMMIQMVQQSPVSIVVTTPEDLIVYVNDRFTELTGYARHEVMGRKPSLLKSGLTRPEVYADLWRTLRHGIWRGEFVNRKKNGELYWEAATIGPVRDAHGRIKHYLAVKEDISERKRIELENHRLKERLRLATDIATDLVYEVDHNSLQISVFGRVRDEWNLCGLPRSIDEWLEQIHPDDRATVAAAFVNSKQTGAMFAQEYRGVRVDGQFNWWRNRAAPVRDPDGNISKWVGVILNITEERRVQERLRELADGVQAKNEQLEEAVRRANAATEAKGRFVANMSHEVRTPLNGIIGTAEVLLQSDATEEQRECLEAIRDSGLSLLTVLNDVLDLSKLEAGKMEIQSTEYEPSRIASEAVRLMRPVASAKGLRIDVAVDADVPRRIGGDPDRVAQILHNLVSNGIKFTPAGAVDIRVSRIYDSREWIEYSVRDTGIGIPEAEHAAIFESFVQVDASHTRRFGGTGLGLAISKQLAALMGGEIRVSSRPAEGSTFTLRLPLEPAAMKTRARRRPAPAAPFPMLPRTILLAEDNPLNQRIVKRLLEKAGYRVNVVNDGAEVVKAALTQPPDLVLMDIQMPGVDGMDAARRIREHARFARTPIIALTANAMQGDRELYLSAGMDDYLAKPISSTDLIERVAQWLNGGPPAP